ncbi:MAG: hypothetical protein Q9186_000545 [Xanthomendoza sp. 1 TL-2023]
MSLGRLWKSLARRGQPGYSVRISFSTRPPNNPFLHISEEIQEAVHSKRPVVALETTIYTHGFPYPQNTALASHLESVVRLNGGIPATIGVLNGIARVGLSPEEIIELTASAGKPGTKKVSRRDLGYLCGLGMTGIKFNGGTTIAGTMVLAHLAGIKVFATGGLGGVHRGAENSMDISADLTELGRTPVAVISSGCKSFLDIPRTLEYLETQGVGVGTFADGREGKVDFPAFWTRDSGMSSPTVIHNETAAAAIIFAQFSLPLSSGLLFANPVPSQHSIPKAQMDTIITQAVLDADKSGSTGSENTPFVLARIRDLSAGQTVVANRALIEANVIRGTRVACELSMLEGNTAERLHGAQPYPTDSTLFDATAASFKTTGAKQTSSEVAMSQGPQVDVFVAGSLAIDLSCDFSPTANADSTNSPQLQTSNPARITQGLGGVGQNIATALQYVGTRAKFCSVVGDDNAGLMAREMLTARGLSTSAIIQKTFARTGQYVAVNDAQKNLVLAMADMVIMENCSSEVETVWKQQLDICKPKWLVVDANWDPHSLQHWIMNGKKAGTRVAFEPVSVSKSQRLFASIPNSTFDLRTLPDHLVSLATPNSLELSSMHAAAREAGLFKRDDWWQLIDSLRLSSSGSRENLVSVTSNTMVDEGIPQRSIQLLPFIPTILTKLGNKGVLLTQLLKPGDDRLTSPAHSKYVLSRADPSDITLGGIYMRLLPPAETVPEAGVVSVNGVGDTFLGIIIAGLTKEKPKALIDLIHIAQQGSVMTLKSKEGVSPAIRRLKQRL